MSVTFGYYIQLTRQALAISNGKTASSLYYNGPLTIVLAFLVFRFVHKQFRI